MFKKEEKLIEFLKNNYLIIGYSFVTIFALLIRYSALSFKSRDFVVFLEPWFNFLKENGGLLALKDYIGNYNVPYMTILAILTYLPFNALYMIKIVSILFDFGLALSSAFLVKEIVKSNKELYFFVTYAFILFLPQVIMNSSVWGQCDSGYTMFAVLALLFLIKEKYITSFIMLGVSFALKLQFIFIIPIFIVYYVVNKKYSIFYFLIIPIVNLIMCLPGIIAGMSIIDVMAIYSNQVGVYENSISLNFLNIYGLITGDGLILYKGAVYFTLFICFMMLIYIVYKKVKLDNKKILSLTFWFIVIVTFFLPCMHERYLYLGEIIGVLYFIIYRENLSIVLSVVLVSIITYFSYLFGINTSYNGLLIIGYLVVIIYFTRDVMVKLTI